MRAVKRHKLKESIFEALKLLFKNDIEIIENRTKEECINHKFAQYLEEILKQNNILDGPTVIWHVDIEYDKYKEGEKKESKGRKIRPDIIVHQRKSGHRNNFIVIEAKKNYPEKCDMNKVIDLVNSQSYRYSLGVLVSYLPNKKYAKVKFKKDDGWEVFKIDKQTLIVLPNI